MRTIAHHDQRAPQCDHIVKISPASQSSQVWPLQPGTRLGHNSPAAILRVRSASERFHHEISREIQNIGFLLLPVIISAVAKGVNADA